MQRFIRETIRTLVPQELLDPVGAKFLKLAGVRFRDVTGPTGKPCWRLYRSNTAGDGTTAPVNDPGHARLFRTRIRHGGCTRVPRIEGYPKSVQAFGRIIERAEEEDVPMDEIPVDVVFADLLNQRVSQSARPSSIDIVTERFSEGDGLHDRKLAFTRVVPGYSMRIDDERIGDALVALDALLGTSVPRASAVRDALRREGIDPQLLQTARAFAREARGLEWTSDNPISSGRNPFAADEGCTAA